jgi:phosphoribosylformimino-5-aminoimidazole carboxamide ribotide isomerase
MEIIPAIDLMGGKVVRLRKGDPNTSINYDLFGTPLQTARNWIHEGAKTIHIIDLDAAMGRGDNLNVITSLIQQINVPIQVGGGIRSKEKAELLLRSGVKRVIIATLAFKQVDTLRELLTIYGDKKIMIALDYLHSNVMMKGWTSTTGLTLADAIQKFSNLGVKLFLLTSISKDGLLTGPDYVTLQNAVNNMTIDIFAAGGISNLRDLIRLQQIGLKGAIVGKALYEERFSLKDAINVVKDSSVKGC